MLAQAAVANLFFRLMHQYFLFLQPHLLTIQLTLPVGQIQVLVMKFRKQQTMVLAVPLAGLKQVLQKLSTIAFQPRQPIITASEPLTVTVITVLGAIQ